MEKAKLTIASGANQPFWRCQYQYLLSAERLRLHLKFKFIVFNLGFTQHTLTQLLNRFPWCEFRTFNFEDYPPHVNVATRSFAWKVVIIHQLALENKGFVLWLDSATIFKTQLDHLINRINIHGLFVVRGASKVINRCHTKTYEALKTPNHLLEKREFAAGIFGFDPKNENVMKLIKSWYKNSMIEKIIMPESPPQNGIHTDQGILSLLLLTMRFNNEITFDHDEIDISSPSPIKDLTSRNKISNNIPLWMDAPVRFYYSCYKFFDQKELALKKYLKSLEK